MKLKESLILWNPARKGPKNSGTEIKVTHLGNTEAGYQYSGGGCYTRTQKLTPIEARAYIFRDAMTLIIRDHMNPQSVHNAFCEVKEYRDGLSPDTPVPEHLKDRFLDEVNASGELSSFL